MTQKIYTYGVEQGHSFMKAEVDGEVASDYFIELRDKHPDMYNVRITLPKEGVYKGYTQAEFGLQKADKTLGTYSTRVNKLVKNTDPDSRDSHTSSSNTSARKSDINVIMLNDVTVKLFKGDSWAKRNLSGHVETNNFSLFAYWLDALEEPWKWMNRVERMTQCVMVEGKVVECTPPQWVVKFKNVTIDLDREPDEAYLKVAKGEIARILVAKGDYNLEGLDKVEAEVEGGGEEWLIDYIKVNYTKPKPKPLPKSAEAESIEAQSA